MGVARESERVDADPGTALAAWCDPSRWPAFVESFRRVLNVDRSWPNPGAELVWETGPHGRGRVTERVEKYDEPRAGSARFVTRVTEEALDGTQSVAFDGEPDGGGTRVEVTLEYRLRQEGMLAPITDRLFIRRALRHSLGRTLERFSSEVVR